MGVEGRSEKNEKRGTGLVDMKSPSSGLASTGWNLSLRRNRYEMSFMQE